MVVVNGGSQEDDSGHSKDGLVKEFGYVILCLCKIRGKTNVSEYIWGDNEERLLSSAKKYTITGHLTHYGSRGKYYF